MRYEVMTKLTPQESLQRAVAYFGRGGQGLEITGKGESYLIFEGGGGYVAITAQPGHETTLELETREWDRAVRQFMEEIH